MLSGDAQGTVNEKMEVTVFHLSNRMETAQVYAASFVHSLTHKLQVLYENTVNWIESLEWHDKVATTWDYLVSKGDDIFELLQSMGVHPRVSNYFNNIHILLQSEVSKQAICFGFAGLVTGGLVGLCIGYSVRSSSTMSSQYPSNDNSLMRAIVAVNCRRGIDGITIRTVPVPTSLRSDEILVQVKAVGLDNIDVRVASGYSNTIRRHLRLSQAKTPFVLGRECSGVVVDMGSQVASFEVNDRVWICIPLWVSTGVMSEYIAIPEIYACLKPKNISFEGAAVLPYACHKFWEEFVEKSQLGPHNTKNKRILIHLGAATKNDGVGLLATQILKSWGARITISTEESDEYMSGSGVAQMTFLHSLKSLGAESHLIIPNDPNQLPNLTQRIFDVVVNTDASYLTPLLANFIKDPSGYVIETFPVDYERSSSSISSFVFSLPRKLLSTLFYRESLPKDDAVRNTLFECKTMVENGYILPVVAKTFLASQFDQAFRHVACNTNSALAHAHIGKSVLLFKPS